MRRPLLVAGAAGLAALAAQTTHSAAQTGISGEVESVVELALEHRAPGRVTATVTATVDRTQLSVAEGGHAPAALRAFRDPMVRTKVTVRTAEGAGGARERTITFGPQGP